MNTHPMPSGHDRHVVVGAGPVGRATAIELARLGNDVIVASRSGTGPVHRLIRLVAVDATDTAAIEPLARGAAALYNCANPPYNRWSTDWPPLAASLLSAAQSADAVLVTMSNLYGYGRPSGIMTEDHPLAARSRKGRIRAEMWADALSAHSAGRLRVVEARASDFIGAGLGEGSHMGSRVIDKILSAKSVSVIGNPDVPHSWTSITDVARTLAVLGTDERAWGRAWHVPTNPPLTQRQLIHGFCEAAETSHVKVKGIPKLALRSAGLFSPMVRELLEISHQFEEQFVIDSSACTSTFGIEPTPISETIASAIDFELHRPRSIDGAAS